MSRIRLEIDGVTREVAHGRDLLSTCLGVGVDVPHFCWHDALGSVGACRLCAVRVFDGADDREGRIEMACMTPAVEGQRVESLDSEAADMRARVIEWLMVNHPHDCAVCEEGGACHLQDMTVATGASHAALPLRETHAPQPGSRAASDPRDEPLHRLLPLHAVLSPLRRRARSRRLRRA